jgi:hypothetical protein
MSDPRIWVFQGNGARFASAVFSNRAAAEEWITLHTLNGVLTAYPLNTGVYEWATREGYFMPKKPIGSDFVGTFSSAYQEHYHYADGVNQDIDRNASEGHQPAFEGNARSVMPPTDAVTTREELAAFVALLAREAQQAPKDWENTYLHAFLEALAAWISDMDGYFVNRGEKMPEQPSWRTLAQMLAAATIYE